MPTSKRAFRVGIISTLVLLAAPHSRRIPRGHLLWLSQCGLGDRLQAAFFRCFESDAHETRPGQGGAHTGPGNARHQSGGYRIWNELHIDVQVVFPSLLLRAALRKMLSWKPLWRVATTNSWPRSAGSQAGAFKYIAIVPWRRPDLAIQEIRRVKKLWSVAGIFARGIEWDWPLTFRDHWPIYEEAAGQDLPVTVHVGNGSSPTISRMLEGVPRPFFGRVPADSSPGKRTHQPTLRTVRVSTDPRIFPAG